MQFLHGRTAGESGSSPGVSQGTRDTECAGEVRTGIEPRIHSPCVEPDAVMELPAAMALALSRSVGLPARAIRRNSWRKMSTVRQFPAAWTVRPNIFSVRPTSSASRTGQVTFSSASIPGCTDFSASKTTRLLDMSFVRPLPTQKTRPACSNLYSSSTLMAYKRSDKSSGSPGVANPMRGAGAILGPKSKSPEVNATQVASFRVSI